VGPVIVNVFLRELRPFWRKADPEPLPVVKRLARRLGIDLRAYDRKSLGFIRLEAGLVRMQRAPKSVRPGAVTSHYDENRRHRSTTLG